MFDAGAVIGHAIMDDSGWKKGTAGIQQSNKGMMGSMLKSQIAFQALSQVIKVVSKTVGDCITKFVEQEKVETQLNAVLKSTKNAAGLTAKEIKNMASALQSQTTFGDEAILGGQNLLLTFTNIGKDVFPQATETMLNMSQALGQDLKSSAIQLGKALQDPITGVTALRRVGVNFTDAQRDTIKAMVEAGDAAGAQALILKELETEFGGSAKAARDTFGGSLKALQNIQGDLQEDLGRFASVLGRDIAEGAIKAVSGIRDFLASEKGIEKVSQIMGFLGASFEVFQSIAKQLFDDMKGTFSKTIKDITKEFTKLFSNATGTIDVFTILGGVVKTISVSFGISIRTIKMTIIAIIDLVHAIERSANVIGTAMKVITGEASVELLRENIASMGDSWKNFGANIKDNFLETVTYVTDEFKQFPDAAKARGKEMSNIWDKAASDIEARTKRMAQSNVSDIEDQNDDIQKTVEDTRTTWQKAWDDMKESANKSWKEMDLKDKLAKVKDTFDKVANAIKDTFSGITGIITGFMDEELKKIEYQNELKMSMLEESKENQIASHEDETARLLADLEMRYNQGIISEETYELRKNQLEEQRAAQKTALEKKLNAEIEAERKRALAEENEQKKKQFETEKAFSIAQVWIDFATATMGFWAAYAAIPIAGPIIAGVLTATALGIAIAQTVLISQQQFVPALATGGMVGIEPQAGRGSRSVRVNEEGGEIITLPDGSQVIPADISQQIKNNVNSGNSNNTMIDVSFKGAVISDALSLDKVSDAVISKIGRRLGLAK